MIMQKTFALAFATAIAAAPLPVASQPPAKAGSGGNTGSSTIFIPPPGSTPGSSTAHRRPGDHYDNVVGNYIRRCSSLDHQFNRLQARMGPSSAMNAALQLHEQGVEHCNGGARLQGIDELTAAIRTIGGIPRVEL